MRLDLGETYLPGCTLRDVRDVFRACLFRHYSRESILEELEKRTAADPEALFQRLLADGYLRSQGMRDRYDPETKCSYEVEHYEVSELGLRVRGTRARRFKWESGRKALVKLMDRIQQMKEGHYVLYVSDLCVIGSYARREPDIGDVDLLIQTKRKPDWEERSKATRERAMEAGRNFNYWLDELHWPERECDLLLRARSHILSILDWWHYETFKDDPSLFWIMKDGRIIGTPSLEKVG